MCIYVILNDKFCGEEKMNNMTVLCGKEQRSIHTHAHIKSWGAIHIKLLFNSGYTTGIGLVWDNGKVLTFLLNLTFIFYFL